MFSIFDLKDVAENVCSVAEFDTVLRKTGAMFVAANLLSFRATRALFLRWRNFTSVKRRHSGGQSNISHDINSNTARPLYRPVFGRGAIMRPAFALA